MIDFYNNKICLVTGGTGFIGRNIINELLQYNVKEIIVFDRTLKCTWNDSRIKYIKGDLLYDLKIIKDIDFNIVFHQAANVNTTCVDEKNMVDTNFNSFIELIKICENKNAKIIYASSAAVYGNSKCPNKIGIGEEPLNIYGKSKLMMDNYIRDNIDKISIPIIGIRYFNVYGPGESHKNNMMSMVSQIILKIKSGYNIDLFEFGEQKRDFVYVKDVAYCNILCGMYNKTSIFNCGYGYPASFNNIFNIIKEYYKSDVYVNYIKLIYNFFQIETIADIELTTNELNYLPKYDIIKGINDYIHLL